MRRGRNSPTSLHEAICENRFGLPESVEKACSLRCIMLKLEPRCGRNRIARDSTEKNSEKERRSGEKKRLL
ncbi:Hypothetical predicted protein [Octopus vulgaris]|uniref:Uncharacterized protein n=1 Tax=Octopus vulgaris TaxID=6645 RepID=A0AA36ATL3_OCTVU|nr:Hypothetical predicted protein [Octopus vulgaris]